MPKRNTLALCLAMTVGCATTPPPEVEKPETTRAPTAEEERKAATEALVRNFQRVHFEFASDTATEDSRDALVANARILEKYPEIRVEVQGHCDERGTTEYNLALGQRRARAVESYLVTAGAQDAQVTTISFGEERPREVAAKDAAWAANRRAEFRVTVEDPAGVTGTVR